MDVSKTSLQLAVTGGFMVDINIWLDGVAKQCITGEPSCGVLKRFDDVHMMCIKPKKLKPSLETSM